MTTNGASPITIHLMHLTIFASASFFGIRYDWTRLMMLIATTSISSTHPYGVMTSGTKSSGAIEYNTAIAIQSHAPACGETLFPLDKVSVLLVIIFVVFSLRGQRYGERLPKGGSKEKMRKVWWTFLKNQRILAYYFIETTTLLYSSLES